MLDSGITDGHRTVTSGAVSVVRCYCADRLWVRHLPTEDWECQEVWGKMSKGGVVVHISLYTLSAHCWLMSWYLGFKKVQATMRMLRSAGTLLFAFRLWVCASSVPTGLQHHRYEKKSFRLQFYPNEVVGNKYCKLQLGRYR